MNTSESKKEKIGDATTRKLLRSVVYKGIAAVVYEAMETVIEMLEAHRIESIVTREMRNNLEKLSK